MELNLSRTFKKGIAILSAVAAVGFGTVTSAYAATSQPHLSKSLVALGDSITFGYNLEDTNHNLIPSRSAFPYLIGQTDKLSVSDLGVPGFTTGDLIHAVQTPDFARAIRNANIVTLDIGSNDLLHIAANSGLLNNSSSASTGLTDAQKQAFAAGSAEIIKNLRTVVSEIRSQTSAPILFYNLYNPFPDGTAVHGAAELFETVVNQGISQVAKSAEDVFVVDAHHGFDHNQMTYVRVPEGDIHPTVSGQKALAGLGETTLSPLLSTLKKGTGTVTAEMAGGITAAGGTISSNLLGTVDTLNVPTGALTSDSELSVLSTALSGLSSIVPENEKVIAEGAVHFPSGVTLSKPYTLTIKNSSITSGAAVYQIEGNKFSLVPGAKITSGQVVIPSAVEGDFVVVEPTAVTVPGATKPETGFPALVDGAIAFVLIGLGGGLMYASRRKREI